MYASAIKKSIRRLAEVSVRLFDNLVKSEPQHPMVWPGRGVQVLLFSLGMIAWGWFLNWGGIPFDFHDWSEITAPRLAFLQDAVTRLLLPLHMPDPRALKLVTDRFLSIPDQILSPQVFLLRWLTIGQFSLAQVWLCYAAGFWGLVKLCRALKLSPLVFAFLFLLFNFNGHVVSHLAVGHLTFAGTLLLPWFILLLVRLDPTMPPWQWIFQFSLFVIVLWLQGSFHQVYWCFLFLSILALVQRSYAWTIIKAIFFALLASSFRLLPCVLLAGSFEIEFQGGFPSFLTLWQGLTDIQFPGYQVSSPYTWRLIGWWEFDYYLGLAGALVLVMFSIYAIARNIPGKGIFPGKILLPSLILMVLSIGGIYELLNITPLPLVDAERLTSRLATLPLYCFLVFAAIGMQSWLDGKEHDGWLQTLSFGGLIVIAHDLLQHLSVWRITNTILAFTPEKAPLQMGIVSNHPDPSYELGLLAGAIISLVSISLLLLLYLCEKKSIRPGEPSLQPADFGVPNQHP